MDVLAVVFLYFTLMAALVQSKKMLSDRHNLPGPKKRLLGFSLEDTIARSLKLFTQCEVSCLGKVCKCCYTARLLLVNPQVCGNVVFDPARGVIEAKVTVLGVTASRGTIKVDDMNSCHKFKTMSGELGVCSNTKLTDDKRNPNYFTMETDVNITYNGKKFIEVIFNTVKFSYDLNIEGNLSSEGKHVASVNIVSPQVIIDEVFQTSRNAAEKRSVRKVSNFMNIGGKRKLINEEYTPEQVVLLMLKKMAQAFEMI
ncbi:uncharacterized protein [Halyomorpha halys]|uniref:uncharacterized protein n=1 Tax=Halyomorpha halys TaxID=286706 RepID=UPI0006D4F109|nr:uncharacterized protein LOC106691353 [Halyomorpha halys]